MRRSILIATIAFGFLACSPPPPAVTVSASAAPTSLHSGQISQISGAATTSGGMAPAPIGPMTFAAPLGDVASPVNSDVLGNATSPWTAPVVDRETDVTITVGHSGDTDTVVVTVNPASVNCQFPPYQTGPNDPQDVVTITPTVTERSNGEWEWKFNITESQNHGGGIRTAAIDFQKPLKLSTDSGTKVPNTTTAQPSWAVTSPTAPFTITAWGDAEPGGTTTWDFIDNPPNPRHTLACTSIGPEP